MRRVKNLKTNIENLVKTYFQWQKIALVAIDIIIINISLYSALLIRFDGLIPIKFSQIYSSSIILYTGLNILSFMVFGLYKHIWEYASIMALISIFFSTVLGMTAFLVVQLLSLTRLPYGVLLAALLLNFVLIGGSRFSWRLVRELILKPGNEGRKRALIFGAGDAGETIIREMLRSKKATYNPIAIVDDDPNKQNMSLHGVKVLGKREDIPKLVKKLQIEEIIIAAPSAKGPAIKEIVEYCRQIGVEHKTLPGVMELVDGSVNVGQLRKIEITDLLGRDPVSFDVKTVAPFFNASRVLITGAGGSIGSELYRQIAKLGPQTLILLGQGENSIYEIKMELLRVFRGLNIEVVIATVKEKEKIDTVFKKFNPQIVFHAAAYKHVDIMEENPDEAFANNVIGTLNVAQAAIKHGVEKFVLISSDKAVEPKGVMGASKRLSELLVQGYAKNGHENSSKTKFITVRFGNVLGSRGSVVRLFRRQIEEEKRITITHPEVARYFMTIPEAAMLIIQAASVGNGGEIFVLDMGNPVKIVDLAKYVVELSGFDPDTFPVEFIGLRPGEKLTEELFFKSEKPSKTEHKKIFIAQTDFNHLADLRKDVIKIGKEKSTYSQNEIKKKMFDLINLYSYFVI